MRFPAIALVLLSACTEHGQSPPESVEPVTLETTFQPSVCTGGEPGDPTCIENRFQLGGAAKTPGGTFTLRAEGPGLVLPDLTLIPGELGWSVVHGELELDGQIVAFPDAAFELTDRAVTLPAVSVQGDFTAGLTLRFEAFPL